MSSFTDDLYVKDLNDGFFEVTRDFRYYVGEENSVEYIDVPKGFLTDFFSVPQFFQSIVPKIGKGNQASVLHDYLYANHLYTQKRSDDIFLEAMTVLGMNVIQRYVIYYAVRLFGKFAYERTK
jgi:hypothetical protein